MAYSSTPYVGMTPQKMVATLKVCKWHAQNVCARLVNGLHEPYQVLPWAAGPLTLLESIAKIPDWQVAKMENRLSADFFLSLFSAMMAW